MVIRVSRGVLTAQVPALIQARGARAVRRFFEFFTANIRNRNTREVYHRALTDFFAWCGGRRLSLDDIEPIVVAAYVEYLLTIYSKPTVKQHLAAIRICFDWLVVGQVLPMSCVEDDNQGHPLEVLWEREIDTEILTGEAWESIAKRGFDPAKLFSAYRHSATKTG